MKVCDRHIQETQKAVSIFVRISFVRISYPQLSLEEPLEEYFDLCDHCLKELVRDIKRFKEPLPQEATEGKWEC